MSPTFFEFEYISRKQVIYMRLVEMETLLDEAEQALALLEWDQVREALSRAEAINPNHSRHVNCETILETLPARRYT